MVPAVMLRNKTEEKILLGWPEIYGSCSTSVCQWYKGMPHSVRLLFVSGMKGCLTPLDSLQGADFQEFVYCWEPDLKYVDRG